MLDFYGRINRRHYWICECDCGNEVIVWGTHLRNGHTKSCGCIKSFGEDKISQILLENQINFKKQYTFNDLIDKNKLRFDFAIFQDNKLKCLICFTIGNLLISISLGMLNAQIY